MSEIRKEMGDDVYEQKVRRFFTLIVDDPTHAYSDINAVWNKFMEIFMVFGSLVTYTESWKDYYRQSLQESYDDNVQYLEFRGVLPEVRSQTIAKKLLNFLIAILLSRRTTWKDESTDQSRRHKCTLTC